MFIFVCKSNNVYSQQNIFINSKGEVELSATAWQEHYNFCKNGTTGYSDACCKAWANWMYATDSRMCENFKHKIETDVKYWTEFNKSSTDYQFLLSKCGYDGSSDKYKKSPTPATSKRAPISADAKNKTPKANQTLSEKDSTNLTNTVNNNYNPVNPVDNTYEPIKLVDNTFNEFSSTKDTMIKSTLPEDLSKEIENALNGYSIPKDTLESTLLPVDLSNEIETAFNEPGDTSNYKAIQNSEDTLKYNPDVTINIEANIDTLKTNNSVSTEFTSHTGYGKNPVVGDTSTNKYETNTQPLNNSNGDDSTPYYERPLYIQNDSTFDQNTSAVSPSTYTSKVNSPVENSPYYLEMGYNKEKESFYFKKIDTKDNEGLADTNNQVKPPQQSVKFSEETYKGIGVLKQKMDLGNTLKGLVTLGYGEFALTLGNPVNLAASFYKFAENLDFYTLVQVSAAIIVVGECEAYCETEYVNNLGNSVDEAFWDSLAKKFSNDKGKLNERKNNLEKKKVAETGESTN